MRVGCFFFPHFPVQVEASRDKTLRGRPLIIGGLPYERKPVHDASQEALDCGVRTGMPLREAYALCPQGLFLPLEEDNYNQAFTAVLAFLTDHSPVVEAGHWGLRPQTPSSRCSPGLRPQTPSSRCSPGLRPQTPSSRCSPGLRPQTPSSRCSPGLRPQTPSSRCPPGLRSQAHQGTAAFDARPADRAAFIDLSYEPDQRRFAEEMAQLIERHFHIHSFVSVASNKFVARAASRVAGPGQVMVIPEGGEGNFLKALPVSFLPASSRTMERLELLGIRRMGQLAGLSPAAVSLEFGTEGERLWALANGIDESRLIPWSEAPVLREKICFEPGAETVTKVLASGDELLTRLSQQLKERWQCCLRLTISLHLSNDHIVERVVHFKEATSSRETMLRHLKQCLDRARFTASVSEMRLTVTDLCPESGRQAPIASVFIDEPLRRREGLTAATTWLRQRYGRWVVGRMLAKQKSALPEDSFSFTGFDL